MKEKESNLALPSTKKDLLRGKDYVKNNNKSPRLNKQQRRKKTNQKKPQKTPHCEGYLQRGPLPGGSDLREI